MANEFIELILIGKRLKYPQTREWVADSLVWGFNYAVLLSNRQKVNVLI